MKSQPKPLDPKKVIAKMISCHPDCLRQRGLTLNSKTVYPHNPSKPFTCPLAVAMRGFHK